MANSSIFQNVNFSLDMISAMPLEISTMIFRMLVDKAILASTQVCTSWYRIIQSDPVLRRAKRRRTPEWKIKYDKYKAQFRAKGSHQSKLKAKRLQRVTIDKRQKSSPKKIKTIRM